MAIADFNDPKRFFGINDFANNPTTWKCQCYEVFFLFYIWICIFVQRKRTYEKFMGPYAHSNFNKTFRLRDRGWMEIGQNMGKPRWWKSNKKLMFTCEELIVICSDVKTMIMDLKDCFVFKLFHLDTKLDFYIILRANVY